MDFYNESEGQIFTTVGVLQDLLKPYLKDTAILVNKSIGFFHLDNESQYLNLDNSVVPDNKDE